MRQEEEDDDDDDDDGDEEEMVRWMKRFPCTWTGRMEASRIQSKEQKCPHGVMWWWGDSRLHFFMSPTMLGKRIASDLPSLFWSLPKHVPWF
jgi:hypothetical protein